MSRCLYPRCAAAFSIVAQTAAGKTRSVINNLARQFAEMFSSSTKAIREQRHFALIYSLSRAAVIGTSWILSRSAAAQMS
jgi:hypothetical protein